MHLVNNLVWSLFVTVVEHSSGEQQNGARELCQESSGRSATQNRALVGKYAYC